MTGPIRFFSLLWPYRRVIVPAIILACAGRAAAAPRDLQSDTWVAIDEAGRVLPAGDATTRPDKNKVVGIFYFLWHGVHGYDRHADPGSAAEGVVAPGPGDTSSPHNLRRELERRRLGSRRRSLFDRMSSASEVTWSNVDEGAASFLSCNILF